jgi:hypothetical protein
MIDAVTWEGVQSLLENYAEVRPDDVVVLAYAPDSQDSAAWVAVALEMRGIDVRQLSMTPLRDPNFYERLKSALPPPDALPGRLILMTFERDTMSHDRMVRAALASYDPNRCAVFRAISASRSLFSNALRVAPAELSARNTALLERFMAAEILRIESSGGTSLQVGIDSKRHRWISNRGVWRPGHFVILPAGEVATFPASIDGVLVADFAFNVNAITDCDARLSDHPITVRIEGGRAVDYQCDDSETMPFLQGFVSQVLRLQCRRVGIWHEYGRRQRRLPQFPCQRAPTGCASRLWAAQPRSRFRLPVQHPLGPHCKRCTRLDRP